MSAHTPRAAAVAALLLGATLAGCGRSPQPELVPPPPPSPSPSPANSGAPAEQANPQMPPPDASPGAPAQPAPDAPPPRDSSPVPTPTSAQPAIEGMRLAKASSKMSVAVDLRYQLETGASGGPATLHLAVVPRVAGSNLQVDVAPTPGIRLAPGALLQQKSSSATVYRRQYTVTRAATAPSSIDVLVTMDSAAGSGFGYFTVPLDAANADVGQTSKK